MKMMQPLLDVLSSEGLEYYKTTVCASHCFASSRADRFRAVSRRVSHLRDSVHRSCSTSLSMFAAG